MTNTLADTTSAQPTASEQAIASEQLTADDRACLTAATDFLDYEHETVKAFVDKALGDIDREAADPVDLAVTLYYAVRDGIHYEVYGADLSPQA